MRGAEGGIQKRRGLSSLPVWGNREREEESPSDLWVRRGGLYEVPVAQKTLYVVIHVYVALGDFSGAGVPDARPSGVGKVIGKPPDR